MAYNHIIEEYYKRLTSRNFKPQEVFDILGVAPNEPFFVKYPNESWDMILYEKYKIDSSLNIYSSRLCNYGKVEDIYGYEPWWLIRPGEASGFLKTFYFYFSSIEKRMLNKEINIIKVKDLPKIKFGIILKDDRFFRGFFKNGKIKNENYNKKNNYEYYPIEYLKEEFIPKLPDDWKIHEFFEIDLNSTIDRSIWRKISHNKSKNVRYIV